MHELTTFLSKHALLAIAIAIVMVLIIIIEFLRAKRSSFNIGPTQIVQLINHHQAVIMDVRSKDEYNQGHIIDALSMPAIDIEKQSKKIEKWKNRPMIIVANTNQESQKLAALLLKQGYNAFSLNGGMRAWIEAEMPLVKE